MTESSKKPFDYSELLHPAKAYGHPTHVVADPDLTLNEKRAILASWASDACALEASPELRERPGSPAVRFDDIMDALRVLDREAGQSMQSYRRWVRKGRMGGLLRRSEPGGGRQLQ